jgi:hypothetical protein
MIVPWLQGWGSPVWPQKLVALNVGAEALSMVPYECTGPRNKYFHYSSRIHGREAVPLEKT